MDMRRRGENRVALVTGCSRGIGRAIALRLGAEGYHVVATDLAARMDALRGVADEIRAAGGQASAIEGDVGDPDAVERFVGEALAVGGRVDVLVNNAGVLSVRTIEDTEPEEWDRMFRVNTRGTFLAARALLRHFREREYGRIVNIASIGGKRGGAGQAHYCASKAAVISFTHVLAQEVGGTGITVNAVCPGIIDTEMGRNNTRDEEAYRRVIERTALRRVGEPEDVSGAVAFFASDDAAFITGQTLNVCGGIIFH